MENMDNFVGGIALWELVWKAIALWKSARRSQKAWYVCLVIFQTAGILPIIYLLIYRNKKIKIVDDSCECKK